MDFELIRKYGLEKEDVTEGYPFGESVLVFKVSGKIFMLMSMDDDILTINLKCDPELAIELRERYESVTPGYHMNKTHWNTVIIDGKIPPKEILNMIDNSYELIKKSLPKGKKKG